MEISTQIDPPVNSADKKNNKKSKESKKKDKKEKNKNCSIW